jgi:hypothetical protein
MDFSSIIAPFNSNTVEPVKADILTSHTAINSVSQAAIDCFNGMTEVPYGYALSNGATASILSGAALLADAKRRAGEGDSVNAKKEAAAGAALLVTGAILTTAMIYLAHQAGVDARETAEQFGPAQVVGDQFHTAVFSAQGKGALRLYDIAHSYVLEHHLATAIRDESVDIANAVAADMKERITEFQLRENTNAFVRTAQDATGMISTLFSDILNLASFNFA